MPAIADCGIVRGMPRVPKLPPFGGRGPSGVEIAGLNCAFIRYIIIAVIV